MVISVGGGSTSYDMKTEMTYGSGYSTREAASSTITSQVEIGCKFEKETISSSMTSTIEDTTSTTTSETESGTVHAVCDGVSGAVAVGLYQWETISDDGSIVVKTPTY